MFLNEIDIDCILPCSTDPTKIRFVAYLKRDISAIFPYLNAILQSAIYHQRRDALVIRKEGRRIILSPYRILGMKIIDENDAREIVAWLKERINYCFRNRGNIEPNFERRPKLTALDIYNLLPGTDCGKCGESTCQNFAKKVASERVDPSQCRELLLKKNLNKQRELLLRLDDADSIFPECF